MLSLQWVTISTPPVRVHGRRNPQQSLRITLKFQVQMQEYQSFILIPLDMKPQRRSCTAKGVAWPNQWASTETKHSERKKKKRKLQEVKNESWWTSLVFLGQQNKAGNVKCLTGNYNLLKQVTIQLCSQDSCRGCVRSNLLLSSLSTSQ